MNSTYFNDEGKQLKPFPAHWMTVPARLKVGTRIKLLDSHIATRISTRGPDLKEWDQVVEVVEVQQGYGSYPSRDITDDDDSETVWAGQHPAVLYVSLPYPYSYRRKVVGEDGSVSYEGGTYRTCCHLNEEGVEWEVAK